jgi:hypothetical protein
MPDVSPPLGCPLEIRYIRRFAATMVGQAISRLEKLKWKLTESPSREQVVAWQLTVFEPIYLWSDEFDPPVEEEHLANVRQVCRYFAEFKTVWSDYKERPSEDNRARLRHISRQLNGELAEAYGLPASQLYLSRRHS